MNEITPQEWDRIWRIADVSMTFSLLVAFIAASYYGRIMYPREFKVLTEVNARLAAAITESAKTTEHALAALTTTSQRFDKAVEELKNAEIALENQRRENAIINQRRRS